MAPPRRKLRSRPAVWVGAVAVVAAVAVGASVLADPSAANPPSSSGTTPSSHPSPSPSAAPPTTEVAAVLKRRSAAVVAGDKKAFLADIDPTDKSFVAEQSRLFDNLHKLPLSSVAWKQNGDHAYGAAADVASADGAEAYVPAVVFSYRLKGFDLASVPRAMALTFVKHDDAWFIAADDGVSSLPHTGLPEPWDVSTIVVARTSHALVIGAKEDAKKLPALAQQVEDAIHRVDRMWSKTDLKTVVVYVPRDKTSLKAYFPPTGKKDIQFEGLEFPVYDKVTDWFDSDVGTLKEAGNRVVVNTRYVKPGSSYLPALLRHEVTHVATSRWTEAGAPTWLVEGAAEYTAYRENPYGRRFPKSVFTSAAKGHLLDALPTNSQFYKQSTGYDRTFLLCYYIKVKYGEGKLVTLYRTVGDITKDTKTAASVKKDIPKVLGISQKQLLINFNAWAKANIRPA
jgi:hypothetical protein